MLHFHKTYNEILLNCTMNNFHYFAQQSQVNIVNTEWQKNKVGNLIKKRCKVGKICWALDNILLNIIHKPLLICRSGNWRQYYYKVRNFRYSRQHNQRNKKSINLNYNRFGNLGLQCCKDHIIWCSKQRKKIRNSHILSQTCRFDSQ